MSSIGLGVLAAKNYDEVDRTINIALKNAYRK